MRAGKLRHLVTLQSPAGSRDSVGQRTTTWSDVDDVMCRIVPLKGDERTIDPQRQTSTTHRIEMRYGSEIASISGEWRIKYGSRFFMIDGIRNVEEKGREMHLTCTEGLRDSE